ncbi:hypothetical protein GX408_18690 [bacterium]|nr:hypothetical protein [bacterium]
MRAKSSENSTPELEMLFAAWNKGAVPKKNVATVAYKARSVLSLIDKLRAQRLLVMAGHVALPKSDLGDIAMNMMNNIHAKMVEVEKCSRLDRRSFHTLPPAG